MKTRSNRLNNGYVGGNFLDNSQYGVLPVNKQASSNDWTRPTDWLSLPSMVEGDSKIAGLVTVYPGNTGSTGITASSNFVAFTVYGDYVVDWGDGTTASYSSGVTASKQYLWEGASASTVTSYGFRQRVFQITPQGAVSVPGPSPLEGVTAGLTRANFVAYYPGVTLHANYSSPILDLKISGASLAIINPPKGIVQFEYVGGSGITGGVDMFTNCVSLRRVIGTSWTKKCTDFTNMFGFCSSLQTVPLFNTIAGTTFMSMFWRCTSLQTVPLFNTIAAKNFQSMFTGCTSLQTVSLFNTIAATNFQNMFNGCTSLQTVPLFNTIAGKDFSYMFNGCISLHTVPLFNTIAGTDFAGMFGNCSLLQTVPLFNTIVGNQFPYMLSGCKSLHTVPLFNTTAATNLQFMFNGCNNLKSAALAQPSTDLVYTNCALSAAELNRIFANLKLVGAPTNGVYLAHITITGNWGANECDINIAYNKNWQVLF